MSVDRKTRFYIVKMFQMLQTSMGPPENISAVYLAPVLTETILQLHCQILSPSLQRATSKDAAQVPTCLIPCLSNEAIGVVETKPQALLHGIIKKGLVGWP